jgi:Cu(I)/Ag(I) efflux system membrane fusion protein
LYSEDIAIAKQDYFLAYTQLAMPGDFGKNAKSMLQTINKSYYGLSNAQIKGKNKFRHTLLL